jgi:hypothetical protein
MKKLQLRYHFIHIPKCGGKSIFTALNWDWNIYKQSQHHTLTDLLDGTVENRKVKPMPVRKFNEKFSFTVIRNPWERLVSVFLFFKIDKNITFENWILSETPFQWDHLNTQWLEQYLFYFDKRASLTKVYKLNEINKYWKEICENTIGKQVKLGHLNKTKHGPYRDYYNDKTRKIVTKLCEKDIDLNKWAFK